MLADQSTSVAVVDKTVFFFIVVAVVGVRGSCFKRDGYTRGVWPIISSGTA